VTLADIHLGDLIWSIIVIFFMIVYLIALVAVVVDLFRDRSMSGVSKAVWFIFLFVFPLISVVVYLIVRGGGMATRSARTTQPTQQDLDRRLPSAADESPAAQIATAKNLLDGGAITQAEYDVLKQHALTT
jgi:predicted PurR-regulated permease PerM